MTHDLKQTSQEHIHSKVNKLNRTFARRIGKGLSSNKKQILDDQLPKHLYEDKDSLALLSADKVILEIGFGMGEHFVQQMQANRDALFLGAEVYLNGVAQVLEMALDAKLISSDEESAANLYIWPDDVDILFGNIPDNSLDIIYILFPDPWPKRRQNKKRLVNEERLAVIKQKLKKDGVLIFATDIKDYFKIVQQLIERDDELAYIDRYFDKPHDGHVVTKYNKKAIREGRSAQFMRVRNLR